jgi:hypothetical protein
MGVGGDLNLVSTYFGELAPPNKCGRICKDLIQRELPVLSG